MRFFYIFVFTFSFSFSIFAQNQAEVIVPSTFLRKDANANAEKLKTLQNGEKLTVENSEQKNGWIYVSIENRKIKGWVSVNTIRQSEKQTVIEIPTAVAPKPKATPKVEPKPTVRPTPTVQPTPSQTVPPKVEPTITPQATATISTKTVPTPIPTITPTPEPTPVEDTEVLRVDTEEVSLNVRVVDGNNRFVGDLAEKEFQVFEDDVLQPITSLTTTEVPTFNALVIDNSRSLRSQLSKVIEAGKIIVALNRQNDESAIIRFTSKDKIEVSQDFTRSKASLNNALDNLFLEGGQTAVIDAIYFAANKVDKYQVSEKKEDVKLRSLILVSDGDDRGSVRQENELFELLRKTNVQVYAVGFVNGLSEEALEGGISRRQKAKDFFNRLAKETGGKVYFPDSIDELTKIANEISGELRTQYVISYMPTNELRDGNFRTIKVVVNEGKNKEKRTAITRAGRSSVPQ